VRPRERTPRALAAAWIADRIATVIATASDEEVLSFCRVLGGDPDAIVERFRRLFEAEESKPAQGSNP